MKSSPGMRLLRLALLVGIFVALLALSVAPTRTAQAAFPGTNGQISFGIFNPAIGDTQIWVSNLDGSKQVQLTLFPSEISDWSPDGSRIAFDFFDGQTVQIGTINPDGTGFVQLTSQETVFHGEPAWSPDGTRFAIESDAGNFPAGEGIYLIDSSTGKVLSRVTANPFASSDGNPRWSPNGNWIAFTRFRKANPILGRSVTAVFLVHPDGTGLRQLTQWGLNAGVPDWSPDGSKIVFASSFTVPPSSNIYTIHPDGSGLTLVVKSGGGSGRRSGVGHPRWSPDGTKIIFDGGGVALGPESLWTVNPDGSGLAVIPGTSLFFFFPAWGTHPLQ